METVIRLRLSELTTSTLEKLKSMLRYGSEEADPQIKIVIDSDVDEELFANKMSTSIEQSKNGNTVSFTMEEFTNYVKTNFKK